MNTITTIGLVNQMLHALFVNYVFLIEFYYYLFKVEATWYMT